MERGMSWGAQPQASILTSRVCPWACSFCNEASYLPRIERRPVEQVIDELNMLDEKFGFGSVTIHDSMFFQQPKWLEKWLDLYPKRARRLWPYWAAGRADTVLQWPDLFEALVKETNWQIVSIGFEANSDRMLRVLNKQVTKAENERVVAMVNRIGDEQEKAGKDPVKLWANIMFAIPGETREEAFDTYRLLKRMRRVYPSVAFYTAYPGSALGYQIIAEGKDQKHIHVRDAVSEPVKGIDYAFYRALLRGEYEEEVTPRSARRSASARSGAMRACQWATSLERKKYEQFRAFAPVLPVRPPHGRPPALLRRQPRRRARSAVVLAQQGGDGPDHPGRLPDRRPARPAKVRPRDHVNGDNPDGRGSGSRSSSFSWPGRPMFTRTGGCGEDATERRRGRPRWCSPGRPRGEIGLRGRAAARVSP